MSNIKKYNIFILISTFARNIIEIFSSVLLFKMGYSIKDIMLFYFILYITASLTNTISIYLINIINYKYVLIVSSLIYSYAFYYLNNMSNNILSLVIFSMILGLGSYSYHSIRHYLALNVIEKDNRLNIGSILIFNYIAYILASYIGALITDNFGLIYVVLIIFSLSVLSMIPLISIKNINKKERINLSLKSIKKNKILFFMFEQFKVMFLMLQPLYLFIYIKNDMKYIGIFNIVMGISSIVFVYFFVRKIKVDKYFWLLNIVFCIVLISKINIINNNLMLLIAFLEGLFSRMYEVVSSENLYDKQIDNTSSYLIVAEFIFCIINSILYLIFYIFNINVKVILYICIIGIFLSGFVRYKNILKK